MSLTCSNRACEQPSTMYCYQCKENLCFEHLREHDANLNLQLHPLAFEIKNLSNRYLQLNINQLLDQSREKLEAWKKESHQRIEEIYQAKLEELDRDWAKKLTRPQRDLDRLRMKINEFNHKQKTTHDDIQLFIQALQYIDQLIKDIQTNGVLIDIHEKLTRQMKFKENEPIDFAFLYRTIQCSNQHGSILTHNKSNLFVYENQKLKSFNQNFLCTEEIPWKSSQIYDISWSNTLNQFIFLTDKRIVYLLKENPFSFNEIQTIEQNNWWSCTTSEQHLYLSTYGTDPNIYQFDLQSQFKFLKRWQAPQTAHQSEYIHQINYSNDTLLLIIGTSKSKTTRIELCSATALDKFWSINLEIDFISYQTNIRSCLFRYHQWLIFCENTKKIYHLTRDGLIRSIYEYSRPISHINFFNTNFLIVRTDQTINVHQIE